VTNDDAGGFMINKKLGELSEIKWNFGICSDIKG